jgi:hypothetical protein
MRVKKQLRESAVRSGALAERRIYCLFFFSQRRSAETPPRLSKFSRPASHLPV